MLHSELVRALKKDDHAIFDSLMPGDCDLLHMALGLSGEVGELVDALKKRVIYRQSLDRKNIIEELGDIEFFLEGLRQRLGILRKETIDHNMEKLSARYPHGSYTDRHASERLDKKEGADHVS